MLATFSPYTSPYLDYRSSSSSSSRPVSFSGAFSATTYYTLDPARSSRRYGHASLLTLGRWQDAFPRGGPGDAPRQQQQPEDSPSSVARPTGYATSAKVAEDVASRTRAPNDVDSVFAGISSGRAPPSGTPDATPEVKVDASAPCSDEGRPLTQSSPSPKRPQNAPHDPGE
ncbi:hypothetical protein EVJ58_g4890 [Rhodofomes roseus]|uniref:Uncharacterized protein n=1 Tax=Rhodofomes roseus TaxID=34475 RepID=A0A4Y9YFR7_9APHY|nr:hypothetical protein EVJ58_g4890 [Rhodofomes roseus]